MKSAIKYSTWYCVFGFCFLVFVPRNCDGGLLSSILQLKRPFYYKVSRVVDKISVGSAEGTPTPISQQQLRVKTRYSDCGSSASIRNLQLSSCANHKENSDICEIQRGSNVTFALRFVPKENAAELKTVLHRIIDYVPVPLPCPEPDACENSGLTCPLQAGKMYDYSLSAPIKESYPRMKLWVKGQIEDEKGRNVVCIKIHVRIV